MRSLTATGTAFGFASASASAPSSSKVRYAPISAFLSWQRAMIDLTRSDDENSPLASPS